MLLVAVRGPDLFEPGSVPHVAINWLGAAATLATLPAAIAVTTGYVGRHVARAGRRWGSPGLLVAGRRAATSPGPVARMTAGVVVALGLVIQVVAWQGQFGGLARSAQATVNRIGDSALVLKPGRGATPQHLKDFLTDLPAHIAPLAVQVSPETNTTTVRGRCPSLTALGMTCPGTSTELSGNPGDPRLRELLGWYGSREGAVMVQQADPVSTTAAEGTFTNTVLISRTGGDLSVPDFKQLAYRAFPMGAQVDTIGGEWLTGSKVNQNQGRWITFFGFLGITVLAGAAGITGLAEFLRNGRALAPLTVLSGNRRVHWSTSAFSILVPLALAGIAGSVIGVWLAFPKTAEGASYISTSFLIACAVAVTVTGLVSWAWASIVSVRQAAAWRPRGE
jgi:hypothetical protein